MKKGFRDYLRVARAVAVWLWGLARPAGRYLRDTLVFYWQNGRSLRGGIRLWLTDKLPALDRPDDIRRETRVPLEEQEGIRNVEGIWHIDLPDRCVVCGDEAAGGWIEEPRTALDSYFLLAAPLAGLVFGLLLAWWYDSAVWLAVTTCLGTVAGYALRRSEVFILRLKRCGRHFEHRRVPELSVFNGRLILRLGTREVKLAFLRREQDCVAPGQMHAHVVAPAESIPERIALAETVAPDAAIIADREERRLPVADDRNSDELP